METANVQLISITEDLAMKTNAEGLIAKVARVSNPANANNTETAPRLIKYLIKNQHWSPFELVHFTVQIQTSRAIAQQILRHRSFTFQEFSQRYAEAAENIIYPARRQDTKNRQNSIDDLPAFDKEWFKVIQEETWNRGYENYKIALEHGVAKEQARFLLPLSTKTKLYMCGSVRSWIHYIQLRTEPGTQLEHREIAEEIKTIFCSQFPAIAEALEWKQS